MRKITMNKIIFLIFIVLISNSISVFGMDLALDTMRHEPVIVNYNAGGQLPKEVTSTVIFGATPRISRFFEFTKLVARDAGEILQTKPRSKGMRKDLKELKQKKDATLRKMKDHFQANPYSDTALKCFFAHGFNRKTLTENIDNLLGCVQYCRDKQNLIHMFLPNYFDENDFKDIALDDQRSLIKRFLCASAQFYQQLYTEQKTKQAIYIVIPSFEDFFKKVTNQDTNAKEDQIISDALKECLFDKGINKATLLNQNREQLLNLGEKLRAMGYPEDIALQQFIIRDAGNKEIKIFTPYTVSKKIPSSLLSCVVSSALIETFEAAQAAEEERKIKEEAEKTAKGKDE